MCVFVSIADEGFPEELLTYFVKAPPPNGLPTPELGHRIWPASYPHTSNLHLVESVQKNADTYSSSFAGSTFDLETQL